MSRFDSQVVVDENGKPLAGAIGQVYNITDTSRTSPLPLFSPNGSPIELDQLRANDDGVTPQFTTPGNPRVTWVSGPYNIDMLAWDIIPVAGTAGQVLVKNSVSDFDVQWSDPATGIATGGTVGQVLAKASSATGDTKWVDNMTNVKAFGAKGDGTTDDRAAIQAALDLGGYIYFPQGDYLVAGTLQVKLDGTVLIGSGAGNKLGGSQPHTGTRIRAGAALTGAILLVQRVADDRPLSGIQIMNLAVDGNNVGSVDGINFRASQSIMFNVNIWQCPGIGLRVRGYATPYWDTYDTRFTNVLIGYCGGAGVYMDNNSPDLHFVECVFLYNYNNMVLAGGSSQQVTGCHFYSATRYNLLFNGSGSRSKFANNKFEGSGQELVMIDSTNGGYSDIQFTGNGFSSLMDTSTNNAYDYVRITGPAGNGIGRTTFVGNNFGLKGGSPVKARFAINLETTAAQNTTILANSFGPSTHWGTGVLNNAGNTTLPAYVRGNTGLADVITSTSQTANYTLAASDADSVVEVTSATAVTVTVPPIANNNFAKGNTVQVVQAGAGAITIAAGAGVTLRTTGSLTTIGQWTVVRLRMRATNEWVVDISGGTNVPRVDYVRQDTVTNVIPARPTSDPNILVMWVCWTEPPRVSSGTGGALPNDLWIRRAAP